MCMQVCVFDKIIYLVLLYLLLALTQILMYFAMISMTQNLSHLLSVLI